MAAPATPANPRPEIGTAVRTGGFVSNVLEAGLGSPVVLVHGSGPGVSAYANWRLTIPALAEEFRVVAPDMVGFGFTERPAGARYDLDGWVAQVVALLDTLGLDRASVVGNSFGGAIALRLAARHPDRVDRLVLMGSVGVDFRLTEGLDTVWGYQPSIEAMRRCLDFFAFDRGLVDDELAAVRYRASLEDGLQEAFASMFPAPRQRWVEALCTPEDEIAALPHETLIVHGRDDKVIPPDTSRRLHELIDRSQLHMFGRCGHWTQIEHARRFTDLVRSFLREG
ncbi:alpha/beta fold hydrolase [Pseudonocardia sp. WMMC193]|nr:alpha/beta fold hydrolase [Pseudonocardia sp. WMMC193]